MLVMIYSAYFGLISEQFSCFVIMSGDLFYPYLHILPRGYIIQFMVWTVTLSFELYNFDVN